MGREPRVVALLQPWANICQPYRLSISVNSCNSCQNFAFPTSLRLKPSVFIRVHLWLTPRRVQAKASSPPKYPGGCGSRKVSQRDRPRKRLRLTWRGRHYGNNFASRVQTPDGSAAGWRSPCRRGYAHQRHRPDPTQTPHPPAPPHDRPPD